MTINYSKKWYNLLNFKDFKIHYMSYIFKRKYNSDRDLSSQN